DVHDRRAHRSGPRDAGPPPLRDGREGAGALGRADRAEGDDRPGRRGAGAAVAGGGGPVPVTGRRTAAAGPDRAPPRGGPPAGHPAGWRALVPGLVRPVARTVPWRAIGAGSAVGLLLAVSPRLTQNPDAWFTVQVLRAATVAFAVGLAFLLDDPARHT